MQYDQVFNDAFDRRVQELMREWRVLGVAVVIVPDDKAVLPIYRTYSDQAVIDKPITKQTRFPVASISKLVAALALDKALKQAEIASHFDTLVKDILPDFVLNDPAASARCTIRHVLRHQTTVPPHNMLTGRPLGPGETELKRLQGIPLAGKLGEGPQIYSNIAQSVVLPLVERLSGKSYERYMQEDFFAPLGMVSSGYSVADAGEDLTTGYQASHDDSGIEEDLLVVKHAFGALGIGFLDTACRLITTIEDMAMLLEHLRLSLVFAEMAVPLAEPTAAPGQLYSKAGLGAGTVSWKLDGHTLVGHNGETGGFRASVVRVPSLKCGISILANSTEGRDLGHWIQAWIVGQLTDKPELHEQMYTECLQNRRNEHEAHARTWPAVHATGNCKLVGTFRHPSFGTWEFDEASNLRVKPPGTKRSVPWMCHLSGAVRPVVVSMGGNIFKGAIEWTPGEGQDQSKGIRYGTPFDLIVTDEGIEVTGLDALTEEERALSLAKFRRV